MCVSVYLCVCIPVYLCLRMRMSDHVYVPVFECVCVCVCVCVWVCVRRVRGGASMVYLRRFIGCAVREFSFLAKKPGCGGLHITTDACWGRCEACEGRKYTHTHTHTHRYTHTHTHTHRYTHTQIHTPCIYTESTTH